LSSYLAITSRLNGPRGTISKGTYTDPADYQLVDVEFWDIKKPEWLKHQPFGQMPYLEDTEAGLEFYESRAISRCEYAPTSLTIR
jgi:glutathione S-transferase